MSRKKNALGKSLIRDHKKKSSFVNKEGFRHTCDLQDGFDWACLNLRSVTEQSSVDDFLDQVKLAENEYSKEISNLRIMSSEEAAGVIAEDVKQKISEVQEENKHLLCIPRRPAWDLTTTKEELDQKEREGFLNWRRKLALLKEEKNLQTTPYEKNLEVWKQLWRVIERSDVIMQILDSRNPLLFRCEDLEEYVREVDPNKQNILLLNKADFLSDTQREYWAKYFEKMEVKVIFFSALQSMETMDKSSEVNEEDTTSDSDDESITTSKQSNDESIATSKQPNDKHITTSKQPNDESTTTSKHPNDESTATSKHPNDESIATSKQSDIKDSLSDTDGCNVETACTEIPDDLTEKTECVEAATDCIKNSSKILSKSELLACLKEVCSINKNGNFVTIGLVGYPNVGKSSTINAILMNKKVQVSATPGKTKHFQTIMVDPELCLCDCPGLVFPKFVCTKADMVINGILPIDQLTNHLEPVTLITQLIPRKVLESTYSLIIPSAAEEKDPCSPPTAEEFLSAFGYMRGFMTQRGLPDTARSSRYILKDFVKGKLLYCHPPPDVEDEEYQKHSCRKVPDHPAKAFVLTSHMKSSTKSEDIDRSFFAKSCNQAHMKGISPCSYLSKGNSAKNISNDSKPWKKHRNHNKREKLRRVYAVPN